MYNWRNRAEEYRYDCTLRVFMQTDLASITDRRSKETS